MKLALGLVLAYVVYAAAAFFLQRAVIFPSGLAAPGLRDPERIPGLERHWQDLSGGRAEMWYLAPLGPPRGPRSPRPSNSPDSPGGRGREALADAPHAALIFAHGNAERIDHWPRAMWEIREQGLALLLVEYPGYGRSEGSPSQASITEAMVAGYDWLAARPDVDAQRIAAYGRSLGGGAACALSRERSLAALILQSTFTGLRPFALRMGLPGFVVRDPFDNAAAVEAYPGPVLVAHGRSDDIIPHAHGQALAESARNGRFLSYEARHNDFPPDPDAFWDDVGDFLRESGVLEDGLDGGRVGGPSGEIERPQ